MSQGSKEKYTAKQKRKAEHIEQSYEERGVDRDEARARAWATVNKQSGGGERAGGSGRETSPEAKQAARKSSARRAAASRRGAGHALEDLTRAELLELARKRNLAGRSAMRKQELLEALRQHA